MPSPVRPVAARRAATAAALAELEAEGWLLLHDLQRPGRRFATIDHIAVGPGGVVVVDTKDWAGQVEVSAGTLCQNGVRRDRECELAAGSAASVTAWLEPGHRTAVRAVIALVDQPTPQGQPAAIAVHGIADLVPALRALPHRLGAEEVRDVADRLRRTLADGSIPAQLTTASLATAIEEAPGGRRDGATRAPLRSLLRSRLTRIRRNSH